MNFFSDLNPVLLGQAMALDLQGQWINDRESLHKYAHDETEDLLYYPGSVFIPENVESISLLLRFCNQHALPVVARGGGTSLSGAALPVFGGIVISTEKLNRVLEVDTRNLQACVQPGVITEEFMNQVEAQGLYYPVDPSSKGSCFMGGNVAHGSGGPRVVKYGTIREYILNLQVVLASGEVIWTGANTIKNASGYNLTQLMIGSEGTLGIITEIVVKLIPRPTASVLLMALFSDAEQACNAVSAVFRAGFTPSALEFMERAGIEWVVQHEGVHFETPEGITAWLMIELDGKDATALPLQAEELSEVLFQCGSENVLFADTSSQKESWWKVRRKMAESVKTHSVYKEEDTVVPRAELARLLSGIKSIGTEYGFTSICYGHAGDGNLHINILKTGMSEARWKSDLPAAITKIFELTISLGGTLSGEHGIGLVQKQYMHLKFSPAHLQLLKGIKDVFDPKGILNPGKMIPDDITAVN